MNSSLSHLIGRAVSDHFPVLGAFSEFKRLANGADQDVESADWPVNTDSGLHGLSLRIHGSDMVEIVCSCRDRREEFEFFVGEVNEDEIVPTLTRFLDLVLALPKDALKGKSTIREVLDYRECKGIY